MLKGNIAIFCILMLKNIVCCKKIKLIMKCSKYNFFLIFPEIA